MALEQHCSECQARLSIPEARIGRLVRCPRCLNVFRVAPPEEIVADVVPVTPPETTTEPRSVADESAHSAPAPRADDWYVRRRPRPRRRKRNAGYDWSGLKVVGAALPTVLGVGGGIYLVLVFFGVAGTAASAYSELCDIVEKAAVAVEKSAEPQGRAAATKELSNQAARMENWVKEYGRREGQVWAVEAAARRYEARMQRAFARLNAALSKVDFDPEISRDPEVADALRKWRNALGSLVATADPLSNVHNPPSSRFHDGFGPPRRFRQGDGPFRRFGDDDVPFRRFGDDDGPHRRFGDDHGPPGGFGDDDVPPPPFRGRRW